MARDFPGTADQDVRAELERKTDAIVDLAVQNSKDRLDSGSRSPRDAESAVRGGLTMILRILGSVMAVGSEAILEDQLKWAETRLPHEGYDQNQIVQGVVSLRFASTETLSLRAAEQVAAYLEWMADRLRERSAGEEG